MTYSHSWRGRAAVSLQGWIGMGIWKDCKSSLKIICKVSHLPSAPCGPLLSRERGVSSLLSAFSKLQNKISAGLEMPVLSSEIMDE